MNYVKAAACSTGSGHLYTQCSADAFTGFTGVGYGCSVSSSSGALLAKASGTMEVSQQGKLLASSSIHPTALAMMDPSARARYETEDGGESMFPLPPSHSRRGSNSSASTSAAEEFPQDRDEVKKGNRKRVTIAESAAGVSKSAAGKSCAAALAASRRRARQSGGEGEPLSKDPTIATNTAAAVALSIPHTDSVLLQGRSRDRRGSSKASDALLLLDKKVCRSCPCRHRILVGDCDKDFCYSIHYVKAQASG